jgi:hypothetical protein
MPTLKSPRRVDDCRSGRAVHPMSKPPEHDSPDYPLFLGKPYQQATGEAEAKDFAENILDELGPADAA